jgi:hypothetical protein
MLKPARRNGGDLHASGDDAEVTFVSKPPEDKTVRPSIKTDRATREAAALRANLLKRKEQARRREEAASKEKPDQCSEKQERPDLV